MRKQDLLHTHDLLTQVRDYVLDGQEANAYLDAYDADDMHPLRVDRSKEDHKQAVKQLANGIVTALDTDQAHGDTDPEPETAYLDGRAEKNYVARVD